MKRHSCQESDMRKMLRERGSMTQPGAHGPACRLTVSKNLSLDLSSFCFRPRLARNLYFNFCLFTFEERQKPGGHLFLLLGSLGVHHPNFFHLMKWEYHPQHNSYCTQMKKVLRGAHVSPSMGAFDSSFRAFLLRAFQADRF